MLCESQWPRDLRRGSAATRMLGVWVRIPPRVWMCFSCECCMLSRRGLCVGLITRPEESYRVWCVWMWSWILDNEEALAQWRLLRHGKYVMWKHYGFFIWELHRTRNILHKRYCFQCLKGIVGVAIDLISSLFLLKCRSYIPHQLTQLLISMFHRAFFNSIIDKHQHMHFFTFKTVLV